MFAYAQPLYNSGHFFTEIGLLRLDLAIKGCLERLLEYSLTRASFSDEEFFEIESLRNE